MKKKGKISHAFYVASLTFKSPVYSWALKHLWHVQCWVLELVNAFFPPPFHIQPLKLWQYTSCKKWNLMAASFRNFNESQYSAEQLLPKGWSHCGTKSLTCHKLAAPPYALWKLFHYLLSSQNLLIYTQNGSDSNQFQIYLLLQQNQPMKMTNSTDVGQKYETRLRYCSLLQNVVWNNWFSSADPEVNI